MPIFTVHWKTEVNNWSKIEADSEEDALAFVQNGGGDRDCDESPKKPWGYNVDEGETGQGRITKIN